MQKQFFPVFNKVLDEENAWKIGGTVLNIFGIIRKWVICYTSKVDLPCGEKVHVPNG
jgi:hypothetical protein